LLLSFFFHWPSFILFGMIILGCLSSHMTISFPLVVSS
jgi:hypothetical protein